MKKLLAYIIWALLIIFQPQLIGNGIAADKPIIRFGVIPRYNPLVMKCQGCVAICPTGALKAEGNDEQPAFDQLLCTGCGLCCEFCLDSAVRISKESSGA